VQTAEGGLEETTNLLVRMRELTIQSASDTVGDSERALLDGEYQQLVSEVDRIAKATTFNGTPVLQGDSGKGTLDFHVGASADEINVISFDADDVNVTADYIGIDGTGVAEKDSAKDSIESLDNAIGQVTGFRANLGAIQSRLQSTVNNLEVQTINQDTARSVIQDVDVALSTSKLASANVVKAAGLATLAQANNIPNSALGLLG
jgi:flagellin